MKWLCPLLTVQTLPFEKCCMLSNVQWPLPSMMSRVRPVLSKILNLTNVSSLEGVYKLCTDGNARDKTTHANTDGSQRHNSGHREATLFHASDPGRTCR